MKIPVLIQIPLGFGVAIAILVASCAGVRDQPQPVLQPDVADGSREQVSPQKPIPPAITTVHAFTAKDGTVPIFSVSGSRAFLFTAGMTVNADGAPNAYHPDRSRGLDFLANAGHPGNWWGLATDSNTPSGTPLIQEAGEFKGYYVSHTSLCDGPKADGEVTKYVDAWHVPYIVLPHDLLGVGMAKLGDLAAVYNARNGCLEYAIVADRGPRNALGEGSIALAANLGMGTDLRRHRAGQEGDVIYLIFPETATEPPWPRGLDDIRQNAAAAFRNSGGMDFLETVLKR